MSITSAESKCHNRDKDKFGNITEQTTQLVFKATLWLASKRTATWQKFQKYNRVLLAVKIPGLHIGGIISRTFLWHINFVDFFLNLSTHFRNVFVKCICVIQTWQNESVGNNMLYLYKQSLAILAHNVILPWFKTNFLQRKIIHSHLPELRLIQYLTHTFWVFCVFKIYFYEPVSAYTTIIWFYCRSTHANNFTSFLLILFIYFVFSQVFLNIYALLTNNKAM